MEPDNSDLSTAHFQKTLQELMTISSILLTATLSPLIVHVCTVVVVVIYVAVVFVYNLL